MVDLPEKLPRRIPGIPERFIRTAVQNELAGDIWRAKSVFGRLSGSAKSEKRAAANR
jgi:hypothetical protein